MHFVACTAPSGAVEPAPLSSLPFPATVAFGATLRAFWAADDHYYLCETLRGVRDKWYRIDGERVNADGAEDRRVRVLPFPTLAERTSSTHTGRIVYRVVRGMLRSVAAGVTSGDGTYGTSGGFRRGRTRILAVRAAASRRRPS